MDRILETGRPTVMGNTHVVSAGHYLATSAGYRILEEGGNATDAGVASGLALNVVLPNYTNLGGVAPIILYDAASDSVVTISGLGRWPRAASLDYFVEHHNGDIPAGILRTIVPAAVDAWLTALERYGTMTFEQVVAPALELAERGFPVSSSVFEAMDHAEAGLEWPSTREVFMPDGRMPAEGQVLVQGDLARTLRRLVDAEKAAAPTGREAAIRAARDLFYKGDMAEEMTRFCQEQGGFLTLDDMKDFSVDVGEPEAGQYKQYTIYTCGAWCQGPVLAQALQMVEGDDLAGLGHNSPDYLHILAEVIDLAFADRHYYYGDPEFVDVPIEGLLSKAYARERRLAVDMERAFGEMPPPGDPRPYQGQAGVKPAVEKLPASPGPEQGDTSYACVVDRWGNAFSATPSDATLWGPVVPGLGIILSPRGMQSWLDPDHPSSVQPWKRPRLTPNPSMAFKDGKLFLPFGTPGGDGQVQSMMQVFLNIVEFGMNPQQAIEAPRINSSNFPNTFWPHTYLPGRLAVESGISKQTRDELARRGHDVRSVDGWKASMGGVCAVQVDGETGTLKGGADPRRDGYAIGR